MAISSLPLSYCTNVHPGRTLDEVLDGIGSYTCRVRRDTGQPLAAGLWLAAPVIRELRSDGHRLSRLRTVLEEGGLCCYTLNAFPFGDFHGDRVKEQVYVPDWQSPARLDYTVDCAGVLTQLLPEGTEGSISTVPLGFKSLAQTPDFEDRCIEQLLKLVRRLDDLHDDTGKVVRLAIEPEPLCVLETTDEAIGFFGRLCERAAASDLLEAARRHVGLCYDVCHQSVEFEDVTTSIRSLNAAGVRINKVHITCALRLEHPGDNEEGRSALAKFVEPRYLHQTFARQRDGATVQQLDLDAALCTSPPDEFRAADEWRVHFHVPVNAESLGPLGTTRADLKRALAAVAALPYAPQLEVETYTWGVLPDGRTGDLAAGLARELTATRQLLEAL